LLLISDNPPGPDFSTPKSFIRYLKRLKNRQKQNASIEAIAFPSWPGFVPAIHVFLASALLRRGCPAHGRA
jgi:hypothetical protein